MNIMYHLALGYFFLLFIFDKSPIRVFGAAAYCSCYSWLLRLYTMTDALAQQSYANICDTYSKLSGNVAHYC